MRTITPTEAVVFFTVFLVGIMVMTLLAVYFPDSNSYSYFAVVFVVSILVAGFIMARKESKLNK